MATSRRKRGARFLSGRLEPILHHMPARKPRPPDAKPQTERFIETARALGCDEDEAAFKAKLAAIARHKPKMEPKSARGASNAKKHDV